MIFTRGLIFCCPWAAAISVSIVVIVTGPITVQLLSPACHWLCDATTITTTTTTALITMFQVTLAAHWISFKGSRLRNESPGDRKWDSPAPAPPLPRPEPSISVFWTGVVLPARINRLQQTARHLQLQTQQQHSSQPQRRLRARASPRVVTCHLPRAPLPPVSPHTDTDLYTRHCRAGGRPLLTLVTRAWTMASVTKLWPSCDCCGLGVWNGWIVWW